MTLRCRIGVDAMSRGTSKHTIVVLAAAFLLAAGLGFVTQTAMAGTGLEAARDELRLRSLTEQRMREEFESLLANSRMSAEEIADFEIYLAHLAMLVEEQRRVVAGLESNGGANPPGSSRPAALPGELDRGRTDEEKVALLDAQLGSSLSEFDDKLLREQREIAEKSRSSAAGDVDAEGTAGAFGQSGRSGDSDGRQGEGDGQRAESGGELPAGGSGQGGESADRKGGEQTGETGRESAEGDDRVASAGGDSAAGREPGRTSTPPDIPDGKDDDIVARQLREAAENEQDPELRDKLWEEYRKYKKSTR